MDVLALVKALFGAFVSVIISLGAFFTGSTVTVVSPPRQPSEVTPPSAFPAATTTGITQAPPASSSAAPAAVQEPAKPQTTAPAAPAGPQLATEALNALGRSALVNIVCTTKAGGSFNPISGSGVIIDSRGIILTNAHVAQFFLLRDYPSPGNIECVIRTGSPATPRYTAELLYLPPEWIDENASKIKTANPTGTGESDYALLRITGSTNPQTPLPSSFTALPMDGAAPTTGDRTFIAAYPAGFLGGITISNNLHITSASASVGKLYSFGEGTVDLISLGGTVVAQSGSSGGPVLSGAGKLVGVVVTELLAETTAGRDLRALTISYIDRDLHSSGKGGLTGLLSQDAAQAAAQFNATTAVSEKATLIKALEN